jgi:hypothetical protein
LFFSSVMTTSAYIEPQHQRIETKGSITHRYWFDGLVQCTAWAGDMDAKRWSMKSSHEESRERTKWAGTKSYEAAAKLVMKGWKKGRQQLLDNVEAIALKKDLVDAPSSLYDVAGARPEVPLAVAGDPCCMWDANPLVESKAPTYRLFINISASCRWEAKHLMNWGACILSVVDSLEAQGNCSIEVNICQGNKGGHGRSEFIVRLKEAGQHIDFDIMAFAIAHPSMLRRVMFGCMERVAEDGFEELMGCGYGRPAELSSDVLGSDLYVPGIGDCGIPGPWLRQHSAEQLFPHVMEGFKHLMEGRTFQGQERAA